MAQALPGAPGSGLGLPTHPPTFPPSSPSRVSQGGQLQNSLRLLAWKTLYYQLSSHLLQKVLLPYPHEGGTPALCHVLTEPSLVATLSPTPKQLNLKVTVLNYDQALFMSQESPVAQASLRLTMCPG